MIMAWPLFLVFYFPLIVSAPPGEELLTSDVGSSSRTDC